MSENKKQQLDDCNLRSEEVQEVMGGVPHWIMRWGISLIAIIMAMLVVASYFFRYPEKVKAHVKLLPTPPAMQILISQPCILQQVMVRNGDTVRSGQPLAIIRFSDCDSTLLSPTKGFVNYVSECTVGNMLPKDASLFVIAPLHAYCSSGVIYASADEAGKIAKGQRVIINSDYNKIKGKIKSKATYPDENGRYIIEVVFPTIDITQYSMLILNAEADIIIKDKRLIEYLLPTFHIKY